MQSGKRFDHVWSELLLCAETLKSAARKLDASITSYRRAAYRFAVKCMEAQEGHWNELLTACKSEKTSPEDWINDHFLVIENIGDSRRDLFAAIKKGMTEAEYVRRGPTAWLKNAIDAERADRDQKEASTVIDKVSKDQEIPVAEKATILEKQNRSLVSENRELKRQLALMAARLHAAEKKLERMGRLVAA